MPLLFFFSTAMTNIHQRKSGTYGNKQLYLTISKNNEQMNLSCRDYRHWQYQTPILAIILNLLKEVREILQINTHTKNKIPSESEDL